MVYRVMIAIKNQWWSDQVPLATFTAAQRHRKVVALRWNDCDTAIATSDGRTLAFQESLKEQQALIEMLKA
jgi:hypothetical protein